jgi:hypothetical protein
MQYGIITSIFPKYIPIHGIVKDPKLLIVFEILNPVALNLYNLPYSSWIHINSKRI